MLHRLVLPDYHPPRLNQVRGRHWSTEHRAKARLAELLTVEALNQGIPKATGRRRVTLSIRGWPRGSKLPDKDAYDKIVLDALVRAGLLADDGAAGLDGRMTVTICRGPKRTELLLEDVL